MNRVLSFDNLNVRSFISDSILHYVLTFDKQYLTIFLMLNPDLIQRLSAYVAAGHTINEIAALTNAKYPCTRKRLMSLGLEPKRLYRTEERDREIIEMVSKGMTYAKCGEKFGVSRQRVHQIVKGE